MIAMFQGSFKIVPQEISVAVLGQVVQDVVVLSVLGVLLLDGLSHLELLAVPENRDSWGWLGRKGSAYIVFRPG